MSSRDRGPPPRSRDRCSPTADRAPRAAPRSAPARCRSPARRARRTPRSRRGSQTPAACRASDPNATAGVVTVRTRMPASRIGRIASDSSAADAIDTTTGRRAADRRAASPARCPPTRRWSSAPPPPATPAPRARIDSYDPAVTITCRCSLRRVQTTTAAGRRRNDSSFASVSGPDGGSTANDRTRVSPCVRAPRPAVVDLDDAARGRRQFDSDSGRHHG